MNVARSVPGDCAAGGKEVGDWLVDGIVFDTRLRPMKQHALAPVVRWLSPVRPDLITAVGLAFGLAASIASAGQQWWLALALFAMNRVLDGLDGEIARAQSASTDHGGYADMVADTIVYAAVPLGASIGSDIEHIWPITALLIASFYVNALTWTYLSALLEKRRESNQGAVSTSVVMPGGLVEGTETAGFFVVMLAFPAILDWTIGVMAGAVFAGAGLRFTVGQRHLRAHAAQRSAVHT